MRVMFSKENWKEKLNIRKSWKMAGQSLGQISCWLLKVEMVMESVQKAQGCMLVKPPSMYLCGEDRRHSTREDAEDLGPWDHKTFGTNLEAEVTCCVYSSLRTPNLPL